MARLMTLIVALMAPGTAQAAYCDDFAALRYEMAQSVERDADEAYEDAYAQCAASQLAVVWAEVRQCGTENNYAQQIAGGWMAVCE